MAKKYLANAITISTKNRELSLLNLCAVLSQLKDHEGAKKIAKKAVLELSN